MKKTKYLWSPPNIGPDSTAMMLALSILVFVIIVCAVSAGKAFEIYSMTFDSFPRQTLMDVIGGTFGGFWVHAAVCAALIIRNYRSFYAPSSSVYLMKRIEKTYQMHLMSLSMPLTGLAAGFIIAVVMMLICRAKYMDLGWYGSLENCTLDIWRALI